MNKNNLKNNKKKIPVNMNKNNFKNNKKNTCG